MSAIYGASIYFAYRLEAKPQLALEGIDITINRGEFVAILGRNGCGKSTLVRHFNALLQLQKGALTVAGINVQNKSEVWRLRRLCGMVFQNPDNQFVSSIVEEDIAFGLENYEVPRPEIAEKVRNALKLVGMDGFEKRAPHTLSGGQKQRVALAGVLAVSPDIIVFDEVTAMLDPDGRREVMSVIRRLHEAGKTIVLISHYVEEAVYADRVYLMHGGKVLGSGTARQILTDADLMQKAGLLPPIPVRLYNDLKADGIDLAICPLTNEELADELCRLS